MPFRNTLPLGNAYALSYAGVGIAASLTVDVVEFDIFKDTWLDLLYFRFALIVFQILVKGNVCSFFCPEFPILSDVILHVCFASLYFERSLVASFHVSPAVSKLMNYPHGRVVYCFHVVFGSSRDALVLLHRPYRLQLL